MRSCILLLLLNVPFFLVAQTIPKIGTDSTVDIANWNVEWFGNASNGPTNEVLQQQNVLKVIQSADMDLWALCEISGPAAWDSLLARLPDYGGTISTWSQTQKTALLYKKSVFRLLYSKHILAVYELEFASGRLPLEVGLEVDMGSWKDTIYAFVIHLKANTGTTTEKVDAWDKRKRSSEALKTYIDALGKWKKCIVLGDWNDDVDVSIFSNYATPFSKLVGDTSGYFYPSGTLSLSGQKSTTSYTEMIDHQCVTKRLQKDMVPSSANVFYLQNYITGYTSNTSDHYPVYSRYQFTKTATASVSRVEAKPMVYVNQFGVQFVNMPAPEKYEILDLTGRVVESLVAGNVYVVRFESKGQLHTVKFIVPEDSSY